MERKVTVKTWIKSLENSRSTRCLELYRGDEKLAGCETYWAVLNTQIRRPENLALPHEHFIKYPEHSATEKSVQRINLDVTFEKVLDYKSTVIRFRYCKSCKQRENTWNGV